jgi:hypothetical protein
MSKAVKAQVTQIQNWGWNFCEDLYKWDNPVWSLPPLFFLGGGIMFYCFQPDFWFHPQFFVLEKTGDQYPPSSGYFADNSNGP